MERYSGTLEFDYLGSVKVIDYTMDNLGGNAHIYFTDKRGGHHCFFRSAGVWRYQYNVEPSWSRAFKVVLFKVFDLAVDRHFGRVGSA